jgi:hypothetical protein
MTTQHVINNVVSTPTLTVPNTVRKRKVKLSVRFIIYSAKFKMRNSNCNSFFISYLGSIKHTRAFISSLYKRRYVLQG